MAEGAIKELKRGSGRKMMINLSPAKIWDHRIELESLIRSHTALDIYELRGEVSDTLLSGKTADISPFVEHEWYNFVKWFYHGSAFPEPKEVHRRWLGPSMDIGSAMCSKIIKPNGRIINFSIYRAITEEENQDPTEKKLRNEFDSSLIKKLGQPMSEQTLHAIDPVAVTPEHNIYSDKVDGTQDHVPDADDLVVTPNTQDNYVGA